MMPANWSGFDVSYFRDIINPLGPEYGATARGADAAQHTQQSMDDMLELAMALDESDRRRIASQIYDRRQRAARDAARSRIFKYIVLAVLVAFCVIVWQLGDDSSALSGAYRAFMATPSSQAHNRAASPARAVRALDTQESDPVTCNSDARARSTLPLCPDI